MNAFCYISISMLVHSYFKMKWNPIKINAFISRFFFNLRQHNAEYGNLSNYVLFDVYALSRGIITFITLSNNKYANSVLWSIVQMHFSGEFRVDEIPCSVFVVL